MADFAYSPILPLGEDTTPYRLLTTEGVSTVEAAGRTFLQVDPEVLTAHRGGALDLLGAGAGGLGGGTARLLLGVDLAAEVDGHPDEDDHRQCCGGEPDADGAALITRAPRRETADAGGHHRRSR